MSLVLRRRLAAAALCALASLASRHGRAADEPPALSDPVAPDPPPLVVQVTAPRDLSVWTAAGSGSTIDTADILRTRPAHASELLNRTPGTWISRGDGQESLTAIRSPVLTGAGACGAFLFLEDGIPIRPAGFCNANAPFELNFAQAARVEIARGPASSLYGANALHGAINVVSPRPGMAESMYGLELGQDDTATGRVSYGTEHWRLDGQGESTHGYRDAAGLGEQKLGLGNRVDVGRWQVQSHLSATNLNQETAGYITGKNAYRDRDLARCQRQPGGLPGRLGHARLQCLAHDRGHGHGAERDALRALVAHGLPAALPARQAGGNQRPAQRRADSGPAPAAAKHR